MRQPAWKGGNSSFELATLGQGASPLRHVGYRWQAGRVELVLWPAFDAGPATAPEVHTVVRGVRSLRFSYLNRAPAWVEAWPSPATNVEIPRALRTDLVLDDGTVLYRVFALQ